MSESKTQTTDRPEHAPAAPPAPSVPPPSPAPDSPPLHPLHDCYVIAILPFGFVHHGLLQDLGNHRYCLKDARNIRYWQKHEGGLPQLAREGFIRAPKKKQTDVIDEVEGDIHFESFVCLYPSKSFKEEKHV
ncbi:MAG: hypothetical protein KME41_03600 [Candidatus Thiodiazotropha sp. (ex Lucina pensylvanica)]|nr:hypothetical protein [Candidatus Thiodiazotropha sp. (ex Lucina pensylvanica)]MBT3033284.1 hypothetical protein [Candidatus Thiodiazotropha sp. (ex Lucina pensylvanica)]MBT3050969.1 hypothetical protein [Candidatus Thiodiazotropha sp. (ex Codakia orbicularis)]MBV2100959.1 hypothetical protein [Candidatus Thiodiazotropha sp. (ex Codakia orbicularis)]MBV2119503.1 hypothetical protein [Candidatus Thiodiazotropha sp. (ex Lucina aurantia)]